MSNYDLKKCQCGRVPVLLEHVQGAYVNCVDECGNTTGIQATANRAACLWNSVIHSQPLGAPPPLANKSDGSTADYYQLPEGASELQHLISYRDMNSQIGEIFRAAYRYGIASHSDRLRDAKKIKFYIEAEIERLEKYNNG